MTLEECYNALNGDYAGAKSRLMNDKLVDKFIRKFPNDPTIQQLRDAIAGNNRKAAFVAVHTLKGVAANLSFTALQQAASNLTEQLRDGQHDPDETLLQKVYSEYDVVISALNAYTAQ